MIAERRKKKRIRLTRGLTARFGSMGAVILDITDAGARIEHFDRLDVRKKALFRFEWHQKPIETTAQVISSGERHVANGKTVYQSGLSFTEYADDSANRLRDLLESIENEDAKPPGGKT